MGRWDAQAPRTAFIMLKMAPAIEEATVRERAARGQKAGLRTDTAATAAAAKAIEERE